MRCSDTTGPSRGSRRRRFDGFDATESLEETLDRAAESQALIVLAVPMPALPILLGHIRESAAADCPLTDVISVKGAVLDEVKAAGLLPRFVGGHPMAGTARSGWAAGHGRLFVRAPWVISVDEHVDADVWSMVMGWRWIAEPSWCRRSPTNMTPRRPASRICRTCWPRRSPSPRAKCRWLLRWPRDPSGTARGWRRPRRIWCGPCARRTRSSYLPALERTIELLTNARDVLADNGSVADLVEAGHAARMRYDSFSRPQIVTTVIGADNWREELAAAGRAGGVVRSALPVLDSRG